MSQPLPSRSGTGFVLLVAAFATTTLWGSEGKWHVGMARAVITPRQPVPMGGYANRTEPHRSVVQDLHVKALALNDHNGGRALLITCDYIGFRAPLAEAICRRLIAGSGLERAAILLNASHTHTGPGHLSALPANGRPIPKYAEALLDYTRWLEDRVVETGLAALKDWQTATVSYAAGLVDFPVNRREYTAKGIVLGFNPRGPTDRSVPILRVTSADDRLLGVVFGAACHNTNLSASTYDISGDFAGFAQADLEREFDGVQAMFVQGCGGDTSPYPTGKLEYAKAHGVELATEIRRVLAIDKFRPIRGPLQARLVWVELPLEPAKSLEEIEAMSNEREVWKKAAAAQMLAQHHSGAVSATHYRAPLALWQFGGDLTLVGLSGEPVADYVRTVEKTLGPLNLWIAGYCNDVFGYLPTPRILEEGGYESRGLYGGRRFTPDVEVAVATGLRDLGIAVGRLPERDR